MLGSTGSIGKNTLSLAKKHEMSMLALACGTNYALLNEQIKEHKPKLVYIANKDLAHKVNHKAVFSGDIKAFLHSCASECQAKETKLINALVGFAGLIPSKTAQDLEFQVALANKESLVAGGAFLDADKITPIDSEHFGLKFLLSGHLSKPNKLIITASGGAVLNKSAKKIAKLTPKQALKHPNWDMGAKITIDSATMANKLFEVLEAFWLYKIKNIEALIEKTSSIHALVEFGDGSSTAHISRADMKLAIAHALGINTGILKPFKLKNFNFSFEEINLKKYPLFALKDELLNSPKTAVIVNAANDVMVERFLKGFCLFGDISKKIFKAYEHFKDRTIINFEDAISLNDEVRKFIK